MDEKSSTPPETARWSFWGTCYKSKNFRVASEADVMNAAEKALTELLGELEDFRNQPHMRAVGPVTCKLQRITKVVEITTVTEHPVGKPEMARITSRKEEFALVVRELTPPELPKENAV